MQALHSLEMITNESKNLLLKIAHNAIKFYPKKYYVDISKIPNELREKKGIFVSIYVNNGLRGCIGNIIATKYIIESVIECAISAAYYDTRFHAIDKNELNDLKIEISILSDPVLLNYHTNSLLQEKLNFDSGIVLKKGLRIATFLPQVWEQLPNKEEFLQHLSIKASLDLNSWSESDAEIYVYKVEKFSTKTK